MDFMNAMDVSASAMAAQSARMHMHVQNIANADSLTGGPDGGPYRAQKIYFKTELDRASGLEKVAVAQQRPDMNTPLNFSYEPGHPLANPAGYVARPNVNTSQERVDLRSASRAYEANMQAIEVAKSMAQRSLELLR